MLALLVIIQAMITRLRKTFKLSIQVMYLIMDMVTGLLANIWQPRSKHVSLGITLQYKSGSDLPGL